MSIQTCPTDVISATPERIWDFLTDPVKLASWSGTELVEAPSRSVAVGYRLVLAPGFGLRVALDILSIEPHRAIAIDAHLPFGVINHELIQVSPVSEGRTRVTLN